MPWMKALSIETMKEEDVVVPGIFAGALCSMKWRENF
jgi:hypothetical protein